MTNYYTNKPDFTTIGVENIGGTPKNMGDLMDSIKTLGGVVESEGVSDLYIKTGEATLGTTKNTETFYKATKRINTLLSSAKKVHSDVLQNIDSKFTKGLDQAFTSLNEVNGKDNPYTSKYTTQMKKRRVSKGYQTGYGEIYEDVTEEESYNLSDLLDGKVSPIQATKDVYDKRLSNAKEMLAHKDQLLDKQIKEIEGKSAEEIVEPCIQANSLPTSN